MSEPLAPPKKSSRAGRIARRTFLIGSVAVAGGVAFGYYSYKKPIPNPLLRGLGEGEAALTPFVKIDAEGVTLITPRADKGQGAYSVQAHLIAEELDVDPHDVSLSPGEPDPAYYNGVALQEGTPFPAYDQSWIAERARGFMQVPAKLLGVQMTGGSTTVPDMFDRLRHAGAVARETLKAAAARQLGVSASSLRTDNGFVIAANGSRLAYTELAKAAAELEPVIDVELRAPDEWRYIGKPQRRTDIVAKSTGAAIYGIDLAPEDVLYATVRTNPGVGGSLNGYDASDAENMRGVRKVVPITNGVGVIADNTWRAFRAINAVSFDWGPVPYPASSDEMWRVLEESLAPDFRDSRNRNDGDVDLAFAEGGYVEAEYRLPYLAHAPMEPMNAVVRVTDTRVDIWTGTQIPRFMEDHVADLTGLDADDVHIHVQQMGGSFGHRLEDTYALQAVEVAMSMPGTPIKMPWSREEDMSHDYPRPMQLARVRGRARDGRVDTIDLDIASQSVVASWFGRLLMAPPGPDVVIVTGAWDQPFAIPNYRVTGYRAPEMVPVSSWRSVGASGNGFIFGGFLDELIHAAGADPLEELLRLCEHDVSRKVLEAVGDMSDWSGTDIGPDRGRGVAFNLSFGVPVAEVVDVTNTERGIRIDRVYVAADVGRIIDPVNFEAQVQGGVIWGLGHAMNCELTYENHTPRQTNYHAYAGMRIHQAPEVLVRGLENGNKIRGIGEPAVPPAAPALANAIFAATGQRIRELPMQKHIRFA